MNANDVIESYVTDVAVHLPRKQRDDVAFELRALLHEGLQARAEDAGRVADAAMATEFVRAFGRPAEVAARYRPALIIIDPADGHTFLRWAVVGLAIIWTVGLLVDLRQFHGPGWDFLIPLGRWWGATLIPSMWWPGVLVVGFGLASWARRRRSQTSEWRPRAGDRIHGGRAGMVMGLVGILCGLFVLANPRGLLDALFGGRAAAAAYQALTYTDTFRRGQAPWLLALLMLNVPLLVTVIVNGRWSAALRRIERGLSLVTCAVLAWTVVDGPVFVVPGSDRAFKFFLVLIVIVTLLNIAVTLHRSVRPAPNQQRQA